MYFDGFAEFLRYTVWGTQESILVEVLCIIIGVRGSHVLVCISVSKQSEPYHKPNYIFFLNELAVIDNFSLTHGAVLQSVVLPTIPLLWYDERH